MAITHNVLRIALADGSRTLTKISEPDVIGPVDYAFKRFRDPDGDQVTVIGSGPLSGSILPGSNRLVVAGRSPVWGSFFPSTIGGAGLPWDGIGVNFIELCGRATQPSVLRLFNTGGQLEMTITPIDVHAVWKGHGDEVGFYALMDKVFQDYGRASAGRVLAVGPAAACTAFAAIGSAPIKDGEISNIDTWAGRGGHGSRMFQTHNLAAIMYGGDFVDEDLTDRKLVDGWFVEKFQKNMKLVDLEKTVKYRYEPKFKTGGTFGSNYAVLRDRVLSFNYSSIYFPDEVRDRIHDRLIQGHYLKQFDEEIVAQKKNYNCGEPCAAVCKKVDGAFKKDYEPYQAMGPLCGVFDQRAAEQLNRYADAMGFDAIQIGGQVSWAMECVDRGWAEPADFGMSGKPRWQPDALEPTTDSAHNAKLAREVIDHLMFAQGTGPDAMRRGIRAAARHKGGKAGQAAVYNAAGAGDGCMVPNQYWVPGMFAPVPVLGRYYLDYTYDYVPPRELGNNCAKRMVRELMLDNYGMCRFHRGWAEELLPEIVNRFWKLDLDSDAHHRALSRELAKANATQFWETERTRDMIGTYLTKIKADGPKDSDLDSWVDAFAKDKTEAARRYFGEIKAGFDEGVG